MIGSTDPAVAKTRVKTQVEIHHVDETRQLRAEFSVEPEGSGLAIVLECGDGRGRNPDYKERLRQILSRLASVSASIVEITVESTKTAGFARQQKRLGMPAFSYPVRLGPTTDVEVLRLAIGRAQESIGQVEGAKGGNRTRKIRIVVETPPGYGGYLPGEWQTFLDRTGSSVLQPRPGPDAAVDDVPGSPLLYVISAADEIGVAQEQFSQMMCASAEAFGSRSIGFRGGHVEAAVFYQPALDLWMAFGKEPSRFWNAFGFGRPGRSHTSSIVTEINPPVEGINRRTAGAFAVDPQGHTYLAHNGNIGGGTPGIGKSKFLAYYQQHGGLLERVTDGDKTNDVIVIGSIADPKLPSYVASFARIVQEFKVSVTADEGIDSPAALSEAMAADFSPEFAGRKAFSTKDRIVADCTHGLIANTLARLLRQRGHRTANDQRRDVVILDNRGLPQILFEVKPSSEPYSVYQAVGQLFYHTALSPDVRRIAVLPEAAGRDVRSRLRALGIGFVGFDWNGQELRFHGLERIFGPGAGPA